MSRDQNAGRSHNIKINNSSFERMQEFIYLGKTLPNQKSIQDDLTSRLKSGNAIYYSAQNLLSSTVLSKNLKIKIYRTIILPSWSLTLREERKLRVFGNRVLSKIFGPKGDEFRGYLRKLHNEELNDLYSSPSIVRVIKSRRMRWAGHVASMGERKGVYRVWWGNLNERDHLEDPGGDGRITLKWIFRTWDGGHGLD